MLANVVLKNTLKIHVWHVGAVRTQSSQPQKISVVDKGHSSTICPIVLHDLQQGSDSPRAMRRPSCRLGRSAKLAEMSATERDKKERIVDQIIVGKLRGELYVWR